MNIPQTPVNSAFDFNSTIKPIQVLSSSFNTTCIYCKNNESRSLIQDGSFRQCLQCRKHFKAQLNPILPISNLNTNTNTNTQTPLLSQPVSYKTPMFQTMRQNYMPYQTPHNKTLTPLNK